MITLLQGSCTSCSYEATVGIGRDEESTEAVHWALARCAACGLVAVNVYGYGLDTTPTCHECGLEVDYYVDWGIMPDPTTSTDVCILSAYV